MAGRRCNGMAIHVQRNCFIDLGFQKLDDEAEATKRESQCQLLDLQELHCQGHIVASLPFLRLGLSTATLNFAVAAVTLCFVSSVTVAISTGLHVAESFFQELVFAQPARNFFACTESETAHKTTSTSSTQRQPNQIHNLHLISFRSTLMLSSHFYLCLRTVPSLKIGRISHFTHNRGICSDTKHHQLLRCGRVKDE